MKYINDYGDEENRSFAERMELFKKFSENCRFPITSKKISVVCNKIRDEFYIKKCIDDIGDYQSLRNSIRGYYQVICKDSGNAKKLAEIFLSDLFEKINSVSQNME